MKIWTLVWFLVLPPNDDGFTEWEYGQNTNITFSECAEQLAENDSDYRIMMQDNEILGYEIYCRETKK